MRAHSINWNAHRFYEQDKHSLPLLAPVTQARHEWEHDRRMFSDHTLTPHTVWVLPQYWPTVPGVGRLSSTIVLFFAVHETERGAVRRWCAAQHYTRTVEKDLDVIGKEERKKMDGAPCSSTRNVVEMTNPVLISLGHHGLPILAQSFNHLGWIEEAEDLPISPASPIAASNIQGAEVVTNAGSRLRRLLDALRARFRPRRLLARLRTRVGRRALTDTDRHEGPSRTMNWRRRQLKLVTFPDPGSSAVSPNCRAHRAKLGPRFPSLEQTTSTDSDSDSDSEAFVDMILDEAGPSSNSSSSSFTDHDDDCDCDCTTLTPVTLDVAPSILDKTYHMFLDSAAGTVTLATEDNELHEFRYGRARPLVGA